MFLTAFIDKAWARSLCTKPSIVIWIVVCARSPLKRPPVEETLVLNTVLPLSLVFVERDYLPEYTPIRDWWRLSSSCVPLIDSLKLLVARVKSGPDSVQKGYRRIKFFMPFLCHIRLKKGCYVPSVSHAQVLHLARARPGPPHARLHSLLRGRPPVHRADPHPIQVPPLGT